MGVPVRGLGQNPVLRAAFWDAGACQPFWEAKNPLCNNPLAAKLPLAPRLSQERRNVTWFS